MPNMVCVLYQTNSFCYIWFLCKTSYATALFSSFVLVSEVEPQSLQGGQMIPPPASFCLQELERYVE